MLLLGLWLILFQSSVIDGSIGLLKIKVSPQSAPVDVCASYNLNISRFPTHFSPLWDNWHKVENIYPGYGCKESRKDYQKNFVLLKRGNCSFAEKAAIVFKQRGGGVLIVSDELDTPFFDANFSAKFANANLTVALIDEESYFLLSYYLQEYGVENVRVIEHSPSHSYSLDYNILILWLIAVVTLGCGAWKQGEAKLASLADLAPTAVPAPSADTKVGNKDYLGDISLSTPEVVVFFIACSISILLLYYFYDYAVYIVIGIFCYATTLSMFDLLSSYFEKYSCYARFRIPTNDLPLLRSRPPVSGFILFFLCASLSVTWAILRHEPYAWVFQDILGCAFCIFMIKIIRLSSFKISSILLMLFFIYDVFYVFITPFLTPKRESIMVKIATGGAGSGMSKERLPLLFKLPKISTPTIGLCFGVNYSLLGFGDVILPGFHVGFCAAWDVIISFRKSIKLHSYFVSSLIGYSAGLGFTFLAVALTGVGQPALLYLTPSCLFSTLIVAIKRKELRQIWNGKKVEAEVTPATVHESDSLLNVNIR